MKKSPIKTSNHSAKIIVSILILTLAFVTYLSIKLRAQKIGVNQVSQSRTPDIIVQYHAWIDTPYGPESTAYPRAKRQRDGIVWGLWDKNRAESSGRNPESVISKNFYRSAAITPGDYPMIGLYDPDDPEILRWHIRLAKSAGIKAFALSAYAWTDELAGKREPSDESKRLIEIMRKMLSIAQQENFYITWEYWWGGPTDFTQYRDIFSHPNFYKVDGKPLFWIAPNAAPYNYFGNNIQEFDARATAIESQLGFPLYWALSSNHPNMDTSQSTKSVIYLTIHNTFDPDGSHVNSWQREISAYHNLRPSKLAATHIYPGFNDSILTKRSSARISSRDGGATLQKALQKSSEANADFIFLESWNDFSEGTAIEPGIKEDFNVEPFKNDYYKDLRLLASYTGANFTIPPLPPKQSLDPLYAPSHSSLSCSRVTAGTPGSATIQARINDLGISGWGQLCVKGDDGAMHEVATIGPNNAQNTVNIPWIQANKSYIFNLYQIGPGHTCAGPVLSSCTIVGTSR